MEIFVIPTLRQLKSLVEFAETKATPDDKVLMSMIDEKTAWVTLVGNCVNLQYQLKIGVNGVFNATTGSKIIEV
jgi:hypothetical protein